jgi:hypothetical protein
VLVVLHSTRYNLEQILGTFSGLYYDKILNISESRDKHETHSFELLFAMNPLGINGKVVLYFA